MSRARDVYAIIDDVTTPYEPLYVIVSVIVWFRNLSIDYMPLALEGSNGELTHLLPEKSNDNETSAIDDAIYQLHINQFLERYTRMRTGSFF